MSSGYKEYLKAYRMEYVDNAGGKIHRVRIMSADVTTCGKVFKKGELRISRAERYVTCKSCLKAAGIHT